MKESQIQSQIIDYLQHLENKSKLMFQRTNNTPIYQENRYRKLAKGQKRGFPDIIVLVKGMLIGLEVKTEKGKQSKEQTKMQELIEANYGRYYIVRSLEDVREIFELIED